MVKNYGGNKSKKMGRKFVNQPRDRKVRFAEEVEEQYAVVTKLFGNGMAEVKCIDNVTRLCVFRKKFKGRSKRDNMVSMGTVVLIGVRSWEVIAADSKKLEKCDLLEVYSSADVDKLRKMASWENWNVLATASDLFGPKFEDTEGVDFVDQQVLEYKEGGKKARQTKSFSEIYGEISDSSDDEDSHKKDVSQHSEKVAESTKSDTDEDSSEDTAEHVGQDTGKEVYVNTKVNFVNSKTNKNKNDEDDFDIDDI